MLELDIDRLRTEVQTLRREVADLRAALEQVHQAKHDAASKQQAEMLRADLAAEHEAEQRYDSEVTAAAWIRELNERHAAERARMQGEIDNLRSKLARDGALCIVDSDERDGT